MPKAYTGRFETLSAGLEKQMLKPTTSAYSLTQPVGFKPVHDVLPLEQGSPCIGEVQRLTIILIHRYWKSEMGKDYAKCGYSN